MEHGNKLAELLRKYAVQLRTTAPTGTIKPSAVPTPTPAPAPAPASQNLKGIPNPVAYRGKISSIKR